MIRQTRDVGRAAVLDIVLCLDPLADEGDEQGVLRHWPGDSEQEPEGCRIWLAGSEAVGEQSPDRGPQCLKTERGSLGARLNQVLQQLDAHHHGWVLFMQPGDRLAVNGMPVLEQWLKRVGDECQVLVMDEDRVDASGDQRTHCFKPDWNPDLLWDVPYVGRSVCWRVGWVQSMGGFSEHPGIDCLESLFQELLLRAEVLTQEDLDRIVGHLPKLLLHGRELEKATSQCRLPEDVLLEHARSRHPDAVLTPKAGGGKRLQWPLPEKPPMVSLIVPTRDRVEILRPCVDAILERTTYPNFELLIVDNRSRCPETLAYQREVEERDARVRVLRWNRPFNYSAINNFGARHARGEILGLVNNDIEPINDDWLTEMVRHACRSEIGCVGAKLYYPDDTIQHAGVILGLGGVAGHGHKHFPRNHPGYCGRLQHVQNVSAVTAACMLVRRDVFEAVGGLDQRHLRVTYNDVDFCLKVREAGYRNMWTPHAELYHHESVSRGKNDSWRKKWRARREFNYMRRRWGSVLDNDPAYNPNLTLVHEDFSLR